MSRQFDLNDDRVVVVIGSGAGGGTLSAELTAQGIDVVCLEAGATPVLEQNVPAVYGRTRWSDPRTVEGDLNPDMPVMIAKAVGIQAGVRPLVLDATAGLGRDAFVLAELGCGVTMIERQALIAALLEDGLLRAQTDPEVAPIVARMCLLCGNAIELMAAWASEPPQVIYLDPMFPHRDKSALVKKEMRLFRPLAGNDDDAPALLAAALKLATHRVVVKRPRKAPAIAGEKPGYVLEGKSSRFDIYPKKALKTKTG